MDVNGILNALGAKNLEDMESLGEIRDISLKKAVEGNPAYQMVQKIKTGGLNAIIDMASDYVSDFVAEIRDYAMETIVKKASAAALAKLAMLATPVSGIIAAVKAVWDLIQFVRENMSAISGLVQAVTSTLAQAATGDGSVVVNGVEAALCRLIPLAVDVVIRLAGVNVGGAIQGVVDKIRTRVKGIVDKIIAKLKVLIAKTPIGKVLETVSKTKKAVGNAKKGIKDKIDATVDKGIDKAGRLVDPHLDKAVHKFNHSSASKKLAAFNDKAQGFADSVNAFT